MICPGCCAPMAEESYESVPIGVCARCRGVFIPGADLLEILKRRERQFSSADVELALAREEHHPPRAAAPAGPRRCPRCTQPMTRSLHPFSNRIQIERCSEGCGVHLDQDELDYLQILVEKIEDQAGDYLLKFPLSHPSLEVMSEIESFRREASLWHRMLRCVGEELRKRILRGE